VVLVPSGRAASVARAVRASAGGRHGDRGARGGVRVHPRSSSSGYAVTEPVAHAERDAIADSDPFAEPERVDRTVREPLGQRVAKLEPERVLFGRSDAETDRLSEAQPDRPPVGRPDSQSPTVSDRVTHADTESPADAGSLRELIRRFRRGARGGSRSGITPAARTGQIATRSSLGRIHKPANR
jgi:hypothetical protein